MFINKLLENWDENTIKSFALHDLKYIRTFDIDEFKTFIGEKHILVKKHPSGVLIFTTRHNNWGLCALKKIPNEPRISVVYDHFENLFLLLHDKDYKPTHIHINSDAEQNRLNHLSKSSNHSLSQSYQEYKEYIEDSYMDAFEGDSDAIWNID